MVEGEAAATLEGQPLNAGFLPVDPLPTPSSRPLLRVGRRAAALGVAAILATVVLAIAHAVRKRHHVSPLGGVKADLEGTVELTSAHEFGNMLDQVNHERQKRGLPDLCYNQKLIDAAQVHSDDMAAHSKMSHTGSDGSGPADRVKKAGYHWNKVAENVARGQGSVDHVMQSWMNSPGHKANILTDGISHFGMGRKNSYWTQVFGSPMGAESCVLSGGGGDGHGGQCRDVVPDGQSQWHDSDGPKYHCDWYATGNRCQDHGHKFKNFGYTAGEACCACGGGGAKSAGGGGGGGCLDKKLVEGGEWYDADGKQYHCDWYAAKSNRCAKHGNSFRNHGMVAKEACCACGGGSNMADGPGPAPAPPPPAASSSGKCCNEHCNSHSDCAQPKLFCCPYHSLCMGRDTYATYGDNCNACSR